MTVEATPPASGGILRGRSARRRAAGALLAFGWLATRLYLCLQLAGPNPLVYTGYVVLYKDWSAALTHGAFPAGDNRWQYPPGAAPLLTLPRVLPGSYLVGFVALVLLADAAILLILARLAKRKGSWLGCWYWVVGVALLGAVFLGRFDVFPTALAVLALGCAASPVAFGSLTGLAAAVKVWPVTLLAGTAPGRHRRTLLAAGLVGGGLTLGYALFTTGALGFLREQRGRGIEFESLLATPFLIAKKLGWWHGGLLYRYGSVEIVGAHVGQIANLSLCLTALAVGWLMVWRWRIWRRKPAWRQEASLDAALTATLLMVVTSRVISPQYLIWLLGLAACCLTSARTPQRPTTALILVAAGLTHLEYPVYWYELVDGRAFAVAILVLRNLLLLAATMLACRNLWRSTLGAGDAVLP